MTPTEQKINELRAEDFLTMSELELRQLKADFRKEVSEGYR